MPVSTHIGAIREVLETALATSLDGIVNPARGEVEAWDSLAHIEIAFLLEERFGVRFTEEEIAHMGSEADIAELLVSKRAS